MSFIVFASYLLTPLIKLVINPKIKGKENFPSDRPLVICANHLSLWDALVISCTYKMNIRYLAKKSLFTKPILGTMMKWIKAIPVDKNSKDIASLRTAINGAKAGDIIMIFPQGKRHKEERPAIEQVKKGVGFIIGCTNATVLPIGLYTANFKAKWFRRYYMNVGKPIRSEEYRPLLDEGEKSERFERLTNYVFGKVIKLVDEAQNGNC